MAAACGGRVVSIPAWDLDDLKTAMRDDNASWEAELDAGAAAWFEAVDGAWQYLTTLRCAAGLSRNAPEGMRVSIEGPARPAVMGEIRRLEKHVWRLLEDPGAPAWEDKYGEGFAPSSLEVAEQVLDEAWRILTSAARRTRSLRARIALALSIARIGVLRARIAHRSPATSHTPSRRSRTGPLADVFRSLTQAAHAPPRVAAYPRPAIAGGGTL
jgi:hypothetical protein